MQQFIIVIHILVALSLISLVLLQHGKGADVGASFGGGTANAMFGSVGPASFLMKVTAVLTAVFFATSIGLAYLGSKQRTELFRLAPLKAPAVQQSLPAPSPSNSLPTGKAPGTT